MGVRGFRVTIIAVVALALGGCPKAEPAVKGDTTPDPAPPEFASGPALEEPPAGDSGALGHAYMVALAPQLQGRWNSFLDNCRTRLPPEHALNEPTLVTTLTFEIGGDGALVGVRASKPSGNDEFDQVALDVANDAASVPVPPAALLSDDGRLHLDWLFARDRRQAGPAGGTVTLVEWPPARAVPMLLGAGRLAEAARRVAVATANGATDDVHAALLDTVATSSIQMALGSDDIAAQRVAVTAAAGARLVAAAPGIRALATGAVDLDLRRLAVEGLGAIGDKDAIALLTEIVVEAADDEQRGAAARALHSLGSGDRAWEAAAVGLAATDKAQRLSAFVVLAHFPAPAAVPQLKKALQGPASRSVRLAAAAALGVAIEASGHKAGKPLVACLKQSDAAVRAACAQALGDAARAGYRSKVAFWETVKLLKDNDDRVRGAAAMASAALGKASFARELYRLRKESKTVVLVGLADGLGDVPGEVALARLLGLAGSEDLAIRRAVARSLARREEGAARTLLASWTSDSDLEIRLAAVAVVDDEARLRALVDDDQPRVSAAALTQLAATVGRAGALEAAARLLAESPTPAHRATIAGGWLATRSAK